MQQKQRISAAQ